MYPSYDWSGAQMRNITKEYCSDVDAWVWDALAKEQKQQDENEYFHCTEDIVS